MIGILRGYPRIRERFGKLSGYVQLVRPFTLLAPLVAGFLGVLAPLEGVGYSHIVTAIYIGITLALSQACGQCLNQYADADLDADVKDYRPIPSGTVSKEEALGLSWLFAIISTGRAFTISSLFGSINLVLLFFAVFYSMAPLSPRKVWAPLNVLWMAFSRGFLPMIAVLTVYGSMGTAIPYAIIAFLWVMAMQSTKDVPDMKGDKKFGIKTVPNIYGIRGLRIWMLVFIILYGLTVLYFGKIWFMALVPLGLIAVLSLTTRAKITENNVSWVIFYGGLALIYVILYFQP